jgi:hypothetical protein
VRSALLDSDKRLRIVREDRRSEMTSTFLSLNETERKNQMHDFMKTRVIWKGKGVQQ